MDRGIGGGSILRIQAREESNTLVTEALPMPLFHRSHAGHLRLNFMLGVTCPAKLGTTDEGDTDGD